MRYPGVAIWLVAILVVALPAYLGYPTTPQAQAQTAAQAAVETGVLAPDLPTALQALAPELSPSEREALLTRKLQLRSRAAVAFAGTPPAPSGPLGSAGSESQVGDLAGQPHGTPSAFVIGANTLAPNAPAGSFLAEPAADNNGLHVFHTGNLAHAEFSINGGVTWTNRPLPGGPPNAPIPFGDQDVNKDNARTVLFHTLLYLNSNGTNSAVRIFVFRNINLPANCSYTIIQPPTVAGRTVLMDYPHKGLTNNHFYLATNDIEFVGTTPVNQLARMRRFNIDQMVDCVTVSFSTFSWPFTIEGQKVWTPAEGTNTQENMWWTHAVSSTVMRIFQWNQSAAGPVNVLRSLTHASVFSVADITAPGEDCRGGVGNADYWNALNSAITGFQRRQAWGRGRLAVFWMVESDSLHLQGHVHAAVFRLDQSLALSSTATRIAEPHIFNQGFCFGFPHVTANKRGDYGFSLAFGGRVGGGGAAAQGAVGIDDDFTVGPPGFAGIFFLTAAGTHNAPGPFGVGRYGDYFTVHDWEPCEKWFNATNYALLNGIGAANVNSRYIEFGRNRDARCYRNWRLRPIPQP